MALYRVARHGAALWVANLAVLGFGFVIPLAFTRLASKEDYGRFSFVTALLATLSILTAPGLALAVTQAAARRQDGTLRLAIATRLRWSASAAVAVALVGCWFLLYSDRATGVSLLLIAPLVLPAYGLDLASAFLNGRQRFGLLTTVMIGAAVVPAIPVTVLLLARASIVPVTVSYFASLAAFNALSCLWVQVAQVRNDSTDPDLIRYGRRLTWISSLGAVQFYFDRLIVGSTLGFSELAIYSAAKLFQQALKSTWGAVNQIMFPKLASRSAASAAELTRRTLWPIWCVFGVFCLVIVFAAPFVVRIVFGSKYDAAIVPARLLSLAILVGIPGAQYEIMSRAIPDERRLYIQRTTFAVAEIVCTGIGAVEYGVIGACGGTILAYAINTGVGFVLYRTR
jgi:O-antigen/teichoic acid export membrane protein